MNYIQPFESELKIIVVKYLPREFPHFKLRSIFQEPNPQASKEIRISNEFRNFILTQRHLFLRGAGFEKILSSNLQYV
ncbi:hypothetical protein LEP1GSC166_1762 [Leptospira kirschneri]|nr:hypothetical protein LEP1GSC166_1762 [Leptospira kirschneri]